MHNSLIKKCTVVPLTAPLAHPFRIATGQHDSLDNYEFKIELNDGTLGHGEAAIATHITGESKLQTRENLNSIAVDLVGSDVADYCAISASLHERIGRNIAAIAAVEMALLDAFSARLQMPLWKIYGPQPAKLATDMTVVIGDLETTEAWVREFFKKGFRSFKIKLSGNADDDYLRVITVKKFARHSSLIIDANQSYSADKMLSLLKRLESYKIKPVLLEQPVPKDDWDGLAKLTRSTRIPVCADESASTMADVCRLIQEKAVSVINIKLMKFGLIRAAEVARVARAGGMHLMIGEMMESLLASTAAAHMAAGMGCFKYIDLDTPFFIKTPSRIGGLRQVRYVNQAGVYDVSKVKAGIGL